MKLLLLMASFLGIVCSVFAQTPHYIIFNGPGQEPIMAEAKAVIVYGGGKTLHEYSQSFFGSLPHFKLEGLNLLDYAENFSLGFAAAIPDAVLDKVKNMGNPCINKTETLHITS